MKKLSSFNSYTMITYKISLLNFGILSNLMGRDSCMPCDFKLQFPCCN